jgi:MFS transporter, PAT family, beta-lactamase induction signal transducer AmpG
MSQPATPQTTWQQVFTLPMLLSFVMGFSSGLPLLLTGSTLQAWMKDSQVNLGTIGLTALLGLPYTFKFLWAPLLDRYQLPLGRRRGWLLLAQVLLTGSIIALALSEPKFNLTVTALAAVCITFFSATQDIVIDAYRRESLTDVQQGFGSAMYVNGYRVGMLVAGGGALALADQIGFHQMYWVMAAFMLVGILTTLFAPEPINEQAPPKSLREAVVLPFVEFFSRQGAVLTLLFILLYKLGDTLAGAITTPFYLDMGFSKTEIGAVVKLWGFWATILGGTIGGLIILRFGVSSTLFWFGVGQMLSTLGFYFLAQIGHSIPALMAVISFENFTSGLGTAVFIGFMSSLTDKRFTATQYALLSSLMGVPRVILAAPMGYVASSLGWPMYFVFCTLIAIPGLWLALHARRWAQTDSTAAKVG